MAFARCRAMRRFSLVVPALALSVTAACALDLHEPDPGKIAEVAGDALDGLIQGTATEAEIAHRIFDLQDVTLDDALTPAQCDAVDERLRTVCTSLRDQGQATAGCNTTTAFYYAHAVPRCAVRIETHGDDRDLTRIYALDFTGTPLAQGEPRCGDGVLDAGEQCDDGNHELWDGCDSSCKTEEFNGCEVVIAEQFAAANLARVDATTWEGKRSHLMVNRGAAMQAVTAETCRAAAQVADRVCETLRTQMPFTSWCSATTALHTVDGAAACAVRFTVGFHGRVPDAGVFTTALPGVLAFTIR
jgi:cysteine-rich repeat protein